MFKVLVSQNADEKLNFFIDSFTKISLKMFSDTGIEDEELIRENFLRAGRSFYKSIRTHNENILSGENVFGRKQEGEKKRVGYVLGKFHIWIDYTEDITTQTRFIEDIIFSKK